MLAHLKANGRSSARFAGAAWSPSLHFDLYAVDVIAPRSMPGDSSQQLSSIATARLARAIWRSSTAAGDPSTSSCRSRTSRSRGWRFTSSVTLRPEAPTVSSGDAGLHSGGRWSRRPAPIASQRRMQSRGVRVSAEIGVRTAHAQCPRQRAKPKRCRPANRVRTEGHGEDTPKGGVRVVDASPFASLGDLLGGWSEGVLHGKPPVRWPGGSGALARFPLGPGLLTLLGVPPGVGKTAIANQLVFDAVRLNPELKVLVTCCEMPATVLLDRQLLRL